MTTTGYAPVDDLDVYYEVHGSGQPLVLLHGAMSTIGTSFGKVLPSFARSRQVIAIEMQGHGHTADVDRPLTYERMADDAAAVLRHLGIERADVLGYSMGSLVALQVAIRHPDLVRMLVLASGAYERDGFHPGAMDAASETTPENLAGSPFEADYSKTAPNPDDWATLIAKADELDREFRGWPESVVRSITAPALILIGDSDITRPEHAVHMFRLFGGGVFGDIDGLPRSQLTVLPGTTHIGLVDRDQWLISMVEGFLDSSPDTRR
jgi:pimeloyl-ACP methyl ester carboxylesterase